MAEDPVAAAPIRPGMSDRTPPPIKAPITPNRPLKTARALWLASFVVGVTGVVFAFLSRTGQIKELRSAFADIQPDAERTIVDTATAVLYLGSLVAALLVVAIEAALLGRMMKRHGRARWALVAVIVIHVVVAVAATAIVGLGTTGTLVSALLLGQLALACAALITGFVPAASSWFRVTEAT